MHNCSFGSECYGNVIDFDVQGLGNIQITALSVYMVFVNLKKLCKECSHNWKKNTIDILLPKQVLKFFNSTVN